MVSEMSDGRIRYGLAELRGLDDYGYPIPEVIDAADMPTRRQRTSRWRNYVDHEPRRWACHTREQVLQVRRNLSRAAKENGMCLHTTTRAEPVDGVVRIMLYTRMTPAPSTNGSSSE